MLLYAVIARSIDGTILAEATSAGVEGNQALVTQHLIQALIKKPSLVTIGNRKTFTHVSSATGIGNSHSHGEGDIGEYVGWSQKTNNNNSDTLENYFHVQRAETLFFIALSDDRDGNYQRANFEFLMNVQKEFYLKYPPSQIVTANAYAYDKSFRKTLSNLMHYCNTSGGIDSDLKASGLRAEVQSIKNILDINIDLLMRRGVVMENLIEQSEDLLVESQVFNKRSTKLKRAMKRKSFYYKMILVAFALLTIYLMMVKLCGFNLNCRADSSNNNGDNYNNNGGGRFR